MYLLIYWLTDGVIDQLTDWHTNWLIDSLIFFGFRFHKFIKLLNKMESF